MKRLDSRWNECAWTSSEQGSADHVSLPDVGANVAHMSPSNDMFEQHLLPVGACRVRCRRHDVVHVRYSVFRVPLHWNAGTSFTLVRARTCRVATCMRASVPSPPWEIHELLLVKMNDFCLRFKEGTFFALDSKVFGDASIVRIDLWDDVLDGFDRTHFVMRF